jgi:hypothetical protein
MPVLLGRVGVARGFESEGRRLPWRGNAQVAADLPGKEIVNFTMAWHRGSGLLFRVIEDRVPRALTEKLAPLLGKVADEFTTLHARASDPHRDGFAACVASTACG